MFRFLMLLLVVSAFISCSKDEEAPPPTSVIPDIIYGVITEFNVTPIDINTPGKGEFLIFSNNVFYKVDFNAVAESESNAYLLFDSDTILTDKSREFANLGKDAVAYNPIAENQ